MMTTSEKVTHESHCEQKPVHGDDRIILETPETTLVLVN